MINQFAYDASQARPDDRNRIAAGLLASSIVARLPQAMLGLALLVHVHRLTGSFAVAGTASGAYAIARGAGAPALGKLVDRFGQTLTLTATAAGSGLALAAIAVLSPGPLVAVALAAAIGLITPPVGACARALLPDVVADPAALPRAYMFESAALELTFIFGPPLALSLGSLWSTGVALALGGVVQLVATTAFALQPASRNWRPSADRPAARGARCGLRRCARWCWC
jgi:MFS family permease